MPDAVTCPSCGSAYQLRHETDSTITQCGTCGTLRWPLTLNTRIPEDASSPSKPPAESVVHLNFRYSGAWAEYNQRLMARHHALGLYLTASALILSFLYSNRERSLVYYCVVAMVLPISSLLFALIVHMHDCIMADLHVFLVKCEMFNNSPFYYHGAFLPSYHAPQQGVESFLLSRQLYNAIVLFIFLLINCASLLFIIYRWSELDYLFTTYMSLYYLVYTFLSGSAGCVVLESMNRRVKALEPYSGGFRLPTYRNRIRGFYETLYQKFLDSFARNAYVLETKGKESRTEC